MGSERATNIAARNRKYTPPERDGEWVRVSSLDELVNALFYVRSFAILSGPKCTISACLEARIIKILYELFGINQIR